VLLQHYSQPLRDRKFSFLFSFLALFTVAVIWGFFVFLCDVKVFLLIDPLTVVEEISTDAWHSTVNNEKADIPNNSTPICLILFAHRFKGKRRGKVQYYFIHRATLIISSLFASLRKSPRLLPSLSLFVRGKILINFPRRCSSSGKFLNFQFPVNIAPKSLFLNLSILKLIYYSERETTQSL
jgi:hypothetical protein